MTKYCIVLENKDGSFIEIVMEGESKFDAVWKYRSISLGEYNANIKGNYPIVYSVEEV